jgi:hypothetical protein
VRIPQPTFDRAAELGSGADGKSTTFSRAPWSTLRTWALASGGQLLCTAAIAAACLGIGLRVAQVIPRAQAGPLHCYYVRKSESAHRRSFEGRWGVSFRRGFPGRARVPDTALSLNFDESAGDYFRAAYAQSPPNPHTRVDPLHFQFDLNKWFANRMNRFATLATDRLSDQ